VAGWRASIDPLRLAVEPGAVWSLLARSAAFFGSASADSVPSASVAGLLRRAGVVYALVEWFTTGIATPLLPVFARTIPRDRMLPIRVRCVLAPWRRTANVPITIGRDDRLRVPRALAAGRPRGPLRVGNARWLLGVNAPWTG